MSKYKKILNLIILGSSNQNIEFNEICVLLNSLGFQERIKGDHHIFTRKNIEEIVNIQPKGSKAKAYQIKQIRNIILKYHLGEEDV